MWVETRHFQTTRRGLRPCSGGRRPGRGILTGGWGRPPGRRVASAAALVIVRGACRPSLASAMPPRRPFYRTEPRRSFPRNMAIVGIIPARFASTRLPGKPLLSDTGKPLIRHVVEAASRSKRLDRIIVATDDPRIVEAVESFGGEVALTRADHATGTDRVAEVIARMPEARLIVNLQGDEPELSGRGALDLVVELLEARLRRRRWRPSATPIRDEAVFRDPSCVKVVRSRPRSGALLLPEPDPLPPRRVARTSARGSARRLLHLGLYAYRRDFLLGLAQLPTTLSRSSEKLGATPRPRNRAILSRSGSSRSEASGSTRRKTTDGSSNRWRATNP